MLSICNFDITTVHFEINHPILEIAFKQKEQDCTGTLYGHAFYGSLVQYSGVVHGVDVVFGVRTE